MVLCSAHCKSAHHWLFIIPKPYKTCKSDSNCYTPELISNHTLGVSHQSLAFAHERIKFSALTLPSCDFLQPTVTEDFGHLPPEQRRKRLQQKFEEISKELQKEVDQRCVYLCARVLFSCTLATINITASPQEMWIQYSCSVNNSVFSLCVWNCLPTPELCWEPIFPKSHFSFAQLLLSVSFLFFSST